ncbi:MAG: hypothetical protein M3264_13975 [Thermoproteota archaeon]|jgi:hypothetical protein|nr:hypothetical protein [Thermoproteota archaeon]
MTGKISRCNICGEFVQSKRQLKEHKDKNHRITNSKMIIAGRITSLATSSSFIKIYNELRSEKND